MPEEFSSLWKINATFQFWLDTPEVDTVPLGGIRDLGDPWWSRRDFLKRFLFCPAKIFYEERTNEWSAPPMMRKKKEWETNVWYFN